MPATAHQSIIFSHTKIKKRLITEENKLLRIYMHEKHRIKLYISSQDTHLTITRGSRGRRIGFFFFFVPEQEFDYQQKDIP